MVSDDLDMAGAAPAGNLTDRLGMAFAAGCDLALVCRADSARQVLTSVRDWPELMKGRMDRLYGRPMATLDETIDGARVPGLARFTRTACQRNNERLP